MNSTSKSKARHCCTVARRRLMEELRKCEYCTTSYREYQQCYSIAAAESGEKSKDCIAKAVKYPIFMKWEV